MLNHRASLLGAVSLTALIAVGPAQAQSVPAPGEVERLEAQMSEMQRQIQRLRGRVDSSDRAFAAATPAVKAPAAPPTAIVKMSPGNRPSICTIDGLNCISITSRLHLDVGGYSYDPNTAATVPATSRFRSECAARAHRRAWHIHGRLELRPDL
jgi:phosphate-selective porin OprO/OprP